jgi:RNA recognition motif-containing protein
MGNKLYVGNLSRDTTEQDLQDLFAQSGEVTSVSISSDPQTGARQPYGFVEMGTPEGTVAAIQHANGHKLHGRELKVTEIRVKSTQPRTPRPNYRSRGRRRK